MKSIIVVALSLMTVACGSSPTAPTTQQSVAQLTVTVNTPSVISIFNTVTQEAGEGNVDVTHVTVAVPTNTPLDVDVKSMDGLHTSNQTITLTGDYTLTITF